MSYPHIKTDASGCEEIIAASYVWDKKLEWKGHINAMLSREKCWDIPRAFIIYLSVPVLFQLIRSIIVKSRQTDEFENILATWFLFEL